MLVLVLLLQHVLSVILRFFSSLLSSSLLPLELLFNVDMTTKSELTELTELTPTDLSDDLQEVQALIQAADDTAFNLAFQQLPTKAHLKINSIYYVRFTAI
jgi:hypothetical protein